MGSEDSYVVATGHMIRLYQGRADVHSFETMEGHPSVLGWLHQKGHADFHRYRQPSERVRMWTHLGRLGHLGYPETCGCGRVPVWHPKWLPFYQLGFQENHHLGQGFRCVRDRTHHYQPEGRTG